MKYAWIKRYSQRYPIDQMCEILQVSPSGYYAWVQHTPSKRDAWRVRIARAARDSHERSHRIYGYRKVHQDLVQEHKLECCRETVRRVMRAQHLRSRVKHRYIRTTDSDHAYACAENILDRDFTVDRPNKVWVADITYLKTDEGWLYLGAVMDLCGRRIIGWSMSNRITTQLVRDAIGMAIQHRGLHKDLLHHSDRGSQYCSDLYRQFLKDHGIECSMSRTGNCWDNACMESFFGSLKTEWTADRRYRTREEAKKDVFMYIEIFYNIQRRHASLDYVTPVEYEARYEKDHVA